MKPWILGAMAMFAVWSSALATAPAVSCLGTAKSPDYCKSEIGVAVATVGGFVTFAAGLLVKSDGAPGP
jgi:hypothetical protein